MLKARCLGACSMAPAVVVDGEVHGHAVPAELVDVAGEAMSTDGPGTSAPGPPPASARAAHPRRPGQGVGERMPGCGLPVDGIRPALRSPS